jgi:hypothetical protein
MPRFPNVSLASILHGKRRFLAALFAGGDGIQLDLR